MRRLLALIAVMGLLSLAANHATAQDRLTIQRPGPPLAVLAPQPGTDGYVIQVPGRPPIYAAPRYDGNYTIEFPGRPPRLMTMKRDGGYIIEIPGRPPIDLDPAGW